ncbi:MAG: signal peptidase II [Acidimicrobiaceae bacterium]|nr:signal peptidase II [Acidimicrobiaceae bacterium]
MLFIRNLFASRWTLLFIGLVGLDQATKALAASSWISLDPGSGPWLPSMVGQAFTRSGSGELLDGLGIAVLIGAEIFVVRRIRGGVMRVGAIVLTAGLTSNLLDRLGMAEITQGVKGRYVVNWFVVSLGRVQFGNVADVCYAAGVALLIAGTVLAISSRFRGVRTSNPMPATGVRPLFWLRALSSDSGQVQLRLRARQAPEIENPAPRGSRTPIGPVVDDHSTEPKLDSTNSPTVLLPERASA